MGTRPALPFFLRDLIIFHKKQNALFRKKRRENIEHAEINLPLPAKLYQYSNIS